MKKENLYNLYQAQVKDKDTALDTFFQRVLCMTSKMFDYTGLPDSIPQVELEKILQTSGNVGIAKVNGELYALQGNRGGECDAYYRGKDFIVANPWLNLDKTYKIDSDIVVINNTPFADSILPVIGKYGVLYTDAVITLNMTSVLTRITMLISASDDKTKQSAETFLKKILDGDFSVIGENAFFKGVNMQTPPTQSNQQITQLIELLQYYKASLFNDLGLNANYNMKRERLNTQEVSMNIDALMPFVDSMLKERVEGIKRVNEMFGTDITVTLGSSWKIEHENYLSLLKATEDGHDHTETEDVDPVTENETEETQETEETETETEETETETEETQETEETETETEETQETEETETETEETEETQETEETENKDEN
jgi:hypothetical protein